MAFPGYARIYIIGFVQNIVRPRQAKGAIEHAQSADSDHYAHAQIIILAFALHSYIIILLILLVENVGPDQTARMHPCSLIRAFPVRICPKTRFYMAQLIITKTCLYILTPLKASFI